MSHSEKAQQDMKTVTLEVEEAISVFYGNV
jgi:hypothetical protein